MTHCPRLRAARSALTALALLLTAATGRGADAAPRIVFAETSHDFGEVEEGVELHQVFRFHNAGGGLLENVPRILPAGLAARFDVGCWPVPPIFTLIQALGRIDGMEMHRAFNMGLGMVVVVPGQQASKVMDMLKGAGSVAGVIVPRGAGEDPVQLRGV